VRRRAQLTGGAGAPGSPHSAADRHLPHGSRSPTLPASQHLPPMHATLDAVPFDMVLLGGGTLVGRWWPWHPALPQRTIRLGQSVILTLAPRTRALPLSCPPAGVLIGANIVPERNRSWPSPSSILPNFCQHYAFGVQCTVEMHLHHRGASLPSAIQPPS
jgi:hypothetical protein